MAEQVILTPSIITPTKRKPRRKAPKRPVTKRRAPKRRPPRRVMLARGSFDQVWRGSARRTQGGLTKKDLTLNKKGKIVSRKRQDAMVALVKSGNHPFLTKEGKFKPKK